MDPFRVINPTFVKNCPTTVTLLPDKRVLNRRLSYHFERAWVRVNPHAHFIQKKRGCSGRCFSLAPNTQTSRFALCLWQPDYLYCLFFASIFCFEFATHHTRADSFLMAIYSIF